MSDTPDINPESRQGIKRPLDADNSDQDNDNAQSPRSTQDASRRLGDNVDGDGSLSLGQHGKKPVNDNADVGEGIVDEAGAEDDDDDDDDDDREDDESDNSVDHSRRSKRRRANQFLDIEAEVDDEEEDEMDEEDEEAEILREQFIADDHAENLEESSHPSDDRLHREYDQRRQQQEDQDAEQLAETLKKRYRKTHTVYRGETLSSGTVSQKLLMPSINDPAIFAIRCAFGREKDLVLKLYEKKRTLSRLSNPLEILSVFQRDAFKGYIYIEAKKPEAIERALTGMVNVYAKQRIIVPVSEYPDLLKQVKTSDVDVVPGIYVRITRGKYKGDLAVVDNLSENGLEVRCKLIPRLDYGRNDEFTPEGRRIKLRTRPSPRLFSEVEARKYDSSFLQAGRGPRSYIYRGEDYQEGFLLKDFKLQFIQTKDVHPLLEELDRFQSGTNEEAGMDLAAVAASLKSSKSLEGSSSAFQYGDKVEIRRGEQAKTIGKILSVALSEITILVLESGDQHFVNQQITVTVNDLRKVFVPGDHVKVVEGKHADQTGLVIKLEGDSVILLSDQTKEDIRVFANNLIKATDSSTATDLVNSNFQIKDLVQLNASTYGVIVQAEKGLYGILTADGRVRSVKPTGIATKLKLTRKEQVATDKNGLTIRIGDTVKDNSGDKKKEGAVIHIFKNTVFVESRGLLENLGIFAANSLNVSTVSTKDSMVSKTLGPDLMRMNPLVKQVPAPSGSTGRSGGRDKLLNKDVIVNGGNYKGLMGKVVETDDTDARIELHTKAKKIKVNKTKLSVLLRGESIPYLRFIGASDSGSSSRGSGPSFSSLGPSFTSGGRSNWGGATPAISSAGGISSWGGKTPTANPGGTSTWGAGGVSSWGNNDGTSTWGGNAGGTSAWGANGTSTWGGQGGNSTWGTPSTEGNSSWGQPGSSSSWGNTGNSSAWGTRQGNNSTWNNQSGGNSSTWGNNSGGASSWGKGGSSAWGNQQSNSTWGK